MKNRDLWASYDFYTSELTKHARTLALGGAGICWFFKSPDVTFPDRILLALFAFVMFFGLDTLQYALGALLIKWWTQREEAKKYRSTGSIEGDYEIPRWLDRPSFVCFVAKLIALLLGFGALGWELIERSV